MGCYQNLGDWSCRHFQPLAVVAKPDCKLRPEIQKWNEFSGEVRIPNVQCSHPQVHGTTKSMLSRDRMLCEPQSTKVNGNAMANSPAKKGGNEQKGRLRWVNYALVTYWLQYYSIQLVLKCWYVVNLRCEAIPCNGMPWQKAPACLKDRSHAEVIPDSTKQLGHQVWHGYIGLAERLRSLAWQFWHTPVHI